MSWVIPTFLLGMIAVFAILYGICFCITEWFWPKINDEPQPDYFRVPKQKVQEEETLLAKAKDIFKLPWQIINVYADAFFPRD